jgi:hypothetical protein
MIQSCTLRLEDEWGPEVLSFAVMAQSVLRVPPVKHKSAASGGGLIFA